MNRAIVFALKLFGSVSLRGPGGPVTGPAIQRHRLALLALLGAGRGRVTARDKLMALLWPERDAEGARGLLNQAVHALRRAMGAEALLSAGEELQLNPALVSTDVGEFEDAIPGGDLERAAALYTGAFLDGFYLSEAEEFERWVEGERSRLARAYAGAVESLAEQAGAAKDWRRSVDWWKLRAGLDPLDSRVAGRLMLALDASGNRAAALREAEAHNRRLRDELGMEPAPEIAALAQRLRSSSAATEPWFPAVASPPEGTLPPAEVGTSAREPVRRRPILVPVGLLTVAVALVFVIAKLAPARAPSAPAGVPTVDEIAQAVARELRRREAGDTSPTRSPQRTSSIPAYELYLRGTDPTLLRNDSTARLGLDYFRQAVALDSNYASAWAGLARMTLRTREPESLVPRSRKLDDAERAARHALVLDDSLAEAHASLSLVRVMRQDLVEGERHMRLAIALEPGNALYHDHLSRYLQWTGRMAESLEEAETAVRLEPLSPPAIAELARALSAYGRCAEASALLQRLEGLQPPLGRTAGIKSLCLMRDGKWSEVAALQRPGSEEGAPTSMGLYGYAEARGGQREAAERALAALLARVDRESEATWSIALVYLGLGDLDRAVPWINRAIDASWISAIHEPTGLASHLLDSLRADPRIAAIRRRMGLQNR